MLRKILYAVIAVIYSSVSVMPQAPAVTSAAEQALSFDERLGEDDGAALAILFGANLRGNLEPCD